MSCDYNGACRLDLFINHPIQFYQMDPVTAVVMYSLLVIIIGIMIFKLLSNKKGDNEIVEIQEGAIKYWAKK